MPLACLPVPIAGRNRLWRKMVIDGIRQDPDWMNGEYTHRAAGGLRDRRQISCSSPAARRCQMQKSLPTRDAADQLSRGVMIRE